MGFIICEIFWKPFCIKTEIKFANAFRFVKNVLDSITKAMVQCLELLSAIAAEPIVLNKLLSSSKMCFFINCDPNSGDFHK